MPAEHTKSKPRRRAGRKGGDEYKYGGGHAREVEQKRSRGEISCAECRRLKIKCDKQIPCQSCQRRGCATLCPNSSLATGQGTRFVLAATEHLHNRTAKLSARIRSLEDALADLQAQHSNEPHPLLCEDLLSVSTERDEDLSMVPDDVARASSVNNPDDVIDAFGTLSISHHGISRFFGPTGGSESLFMANDTNPCSSSLAPRNTRGIRSSPTYINESSFFSRSFPFTPLGPSTGVQAMVESHLPPCDRAFALCEVYFKEVSWVFRGVTRTQVFDDMLPLFYKKNAIYTREENVGPHDLSLLFSIFAIGALLETTQETSNDLAEHYHQIARAAICLQPVLEKPSLVTIQTLRLWSIYNSMKDSDADSETSMEMTWSLVTLAAHLSQTIGLHRDSSRWGLPPKMVQRRRILFWDLFRADVWQSMNTGRPPSFSLEYVDCAFPEFESSQDQGNSTSEEFDLWLNRFTAECVADVVTRTLTAEAPSHETIMDLDRKIREFPVLDLNASASPTTDQSDLALSMQCLTMAHIRETVLMYIHRSFFAQAIIDHPMNPLKSTYMPSFLAAYRASSTILKTTHEMFLMWPNSSSRYWLLWTFAFSSAVVFGVVVTRCPYSPLATSAMHELEKACVLFAKAAVHGRRAAKALPILVKLREKASYALAAAAQTQITPSTKSDVWSLKPEDTEDELAIFAGRTRLVSAERPPTPSSSSSSQQVMPSYSAVPGDYANHRSQSLSSREPTQLESLQPPIALAKNWVSEHPQNEFITPRSNHQLPPYPNASQYHPDDDSDPSKFMWVPSHPQDALDSPQYQIPGHAVPTYNHPPGIDRYREQHYSIYNPISPTYESCTQLSCPELIDLGFAVQGSRMHERWNSFVQDSTILDGTGLDFRKHQVNMAQHCS